MEKEKRCRKTIQQPQQIWRGSAHTNQEALFQCAELVLPYLQPTDLASISSTCKTLHGISKSINHRRSSDASRGFETPPIPFVNAVDSQPYAYFIYTPSQTLPGTIIGQVWGTDPTVRPGFSPARPDPLLYRVEGVYGCECERCDVGGSDAECCFLDDSDGLTRECGPSCWCDSECGNRVTQKGVGVRLKIVKDGCKGWGLYAAEFIHQGKFVCEYAGELLTTKEARRRQQIYDELALKGEMSPALLVVKEHLPSRNMCMRINVDATRIGNVARFINHSCDGGNLSPVIVRSSGALLPRICFFASGDIQENEELTFSYGDISQKPKGLKCFCGCSSCYGILPSEDT